MSVYPTVVSFCNSARSHGGAAGGVCESWNLAVAFSSKPSLLSCAAVVRFTVLLVVMVVLLLCRAGPSH
jgi:hypothetical protein